MENTNRTYIEEQTSVIVNSYCAQKNKELAEAEINLTVNQINRTGEGQSYFSEIEIDVWKGNNLIDCLAIIMYVQGEVGMELSKTESWLDKELQTIINEQKV